MRAPHPVPSWLVIAGLSLVVTACAKPSLNEVVGSFEHDAAVTFEQCASAENCDDPDAGSECLLSAWERCEPAKGIIREPEDGPGTRTRWRFFFIEPTADGCLATLFDTPYGDQGHLVQSECRELARSDDLCVRIDTSMCTEIERFDLSRSTGVGY